MDRGNILINIGFHSNGYNEVYSFKLYGIFKLQMKLFETEIQKLEKEIRYTENRAEPYRKQRYNNFKLGIRRNENKNLMH